MEVVNTGIREGRSARSRRAVVQALAAPWLGEPVFVEFPAPASTVLARAAGALAVDWHTRMWSSGVVRGYVHGSRLGLAVRDLDHGNSFHPVLVARVNPVTPHSSAVVGRVRMNMFVVIFFGTLVIFGVFGAAVTTYFVITARGTTGGLAAWGAAALAWGFPAAGLSLAAVGWRWAAAQRDQLRDWLAVTCGAMPTPADT